MPHESCEHICWILIKKFKVHPKDEMLFQSGLSETSLRSLFNKDYVSQGKSNTLVEKAPRKSTHGNTGLRVLTRDDECPICFDKFFQSSKGVTQCQTCKNYVHIPCRDLWKRNGDADTKDRCPYCRGHFGASAPIPNRCVPWRKNKTIPTSKSDSLDPRITIPEPSKTDFVDCLQGLSLQHVSDQQYLSPMQSSDFVLTSSAFKPQIRLHNSIPLSRSQNAAVRPRTLGVAGKGLAQFNSTQKVVGPILEARKLSKTIPKRSQSQKLLLDKTVAAIRFVQQVGNKGQAVVEKTFTQLAHALQMQNAAEDTRARITRSASGSVMRN
ncbi:uncharacterized protein LOC129586922 isoform X2 [Paramacrobiotus metropolitanus]|nr:uncharacterized protein LOC129586922 isoform X2 [Paramacrobiotus metropolitanus]